MPSPGAARDWASQGVSGAEHLRRGSPLSHIHLHRELAAPLGRDQDPPGALTQRGGPEFATVESLTRQADEQVSLPYLA